MTFVTWKWRGSDPRREFPAEAVNVLAASVARNYTKPHRFVCITDEPEGVTCEVMPSPVTGLEQIPSPQTGRRPGRIRLNKREGRYQRVPGKPRLFPACYRRLWLFSDAAAQSFGGRVFLLDIDAVIVGDLTPLTKREGSFVGWTDAERFGPKKIAGGAWMLRTGAHQDLWTEFDPESSPQHCYERGYRGSDQGWISYKLAPPPGNWSADDGLLKINWLPRKRGASTLPPHARIIFTAGHTPPWLPSTIKENPWITDHWRL